VFVFVLNVSVNVGLDVVDDPIGTELTTFTAYVLLGPLPEPIYSIRIRQLT
jgi:hypothetical protein